jgi:uncharacterized protein GlcG (DUF336 family)
MVQPHRTQEDDMSEAYLARSQVSLATALRLVEAACVEGTAFGVPVSVAVTDPGGHVIASARMDDAPLGALRLAVDKAYTAVLWLMPSGELHESSQPGGADWGVTSTEGGRIVVYAGGFPLFTADGSLAGGIGVSGGTSEQDASVAQAAVMAVLGGPQPTAD